MNDIESNETRKRQWHEVWKKLFVPPDFELEDYNYWIDEMSLDGLKKWLSDERNRSWLEYWDNPRYERLKRRIEEKLAV